ncbi:MAG: hypothetical protein OEZ03_05790 [Alphaproteobacteria bacterium]|nr:hypothetical protein [Alphaproteobacteria bacterium]
MQLTTTTIGDFPKPDFVPIPDCLQVTANEAFDVEFLAPAEARGIHIQIDLTDIFCFAAAFQSCAGDLWRGRA